LTVATEDQSISGSAGGDTTHSISNAVNRLWDETVSWTNNHATSLLFESWDWGAGSKTTTNDFCGVGYWDIGPSWAGLYGFYNQYNFIDWPSATNMTERRWAETDTNSSAYIWTWDYRYQLFDEYTTEQLVSHGEADLAVLGTSHPWPQLSWGNGVLRSVTGDPCYPLDMWTNEWWFDTYPDRWLSENQIAFNLRESAYRFVVPNTETGQVYSLTWFESFVPHAATNPNASNQVVAARRVNFVGTGGTVYIGNPEHDATSSIGTLPDHTYVLDPPTEQMGNGDMTISTLSVVIEVDESDEDTFELNEEQGVQQFVTVKGMGNVVLRVNVETDTPDILEMISWQGATQDTGDSTKATISRANSTKADVSVSVGGHSVREAVAWVIWAEIDQLITSDPPGTPDDTNLDPHNMPDTEPFEYGFSGVFVTNSPAGRIYTFQNGILVRGSIDPLGVGTRNNSIEYRFVRRMEKCSWRKVTNTWSIVGSYIAPYTNDGPSDVSQDIEPSTNSYIYAIDAPGVKNLFGVSNIDEYVIRQNFVQHIEVKILDMDWTIISDTISWHSSVWVIRRDSPYNDWLRSASGNFLGYGHILIDSGNEPYPP